MRQGLLRHFPQIWSASVGLGHCAVPCNEHAGKLPNIADKIKEDREQQIMDS